MGKSDLAHRLQMRQTELDVIQELELEEAREVKLSEAKGKLVVGLHKEATHDLEKSNTI
jgi:hypothetical protein